MMRTTNKCIHHSVSRIHPLFTFNVSDLLHLSCVKHTFFDSSTGLARADAAATGKDSSYDVSGAWAYASAFAATVREKMLECSGASEENGTMLLFAVGAVGAAMAAFALYLLSLYFDKDPFVFNGGKMGKLEAQSVYSKKCC